MLRVVRGLHGLHAYASETWVDYLLESTTSKTESRLLQVSNELATKLVLLRKDKRSEERAILDDRLRSLEMYPALQELAGDVLSERMVKDLGEVSQKNGINVLFRPRLYANFRYKNQKYS